MTMSNLASVCTRYIVSSALNLSSERSLIYNVLDMMISAIAQLHLFKGEGWGDVVKNGRVRQLFIASRLFGFVGATALTTFFVGPINLLNALALNVSSAVVGVLLNYNQVGNRLVDVII